MDRAQTRLLAGMSVLVLLVGGALYWQGEKGPEEVDPDATELVWEIEPEQVTAVRVSRPAGVLRLEKVEGIWFVREPYDARADEDQVSDLLDALRDLRRGIPVDGADERPEEFGLGSPPEAEVELTLKEGGKRELDVGSTAPTGFRTYLRTESGKIVAANGDPGRVLQADASRFRDRRIFRFPPEDVRAVTITSSDGVLSVRGEGKDWWLQGFGRADANKVDDLVVGLLDLRFDGVLASDLVVEPVVYDVRVELADGSERSLKTGEPSPTDAGIRAVTGDGRAGTIFPEAVKQLGRGPTDLGWRTAFGLSLDESDKVVITRGSERIEMRRNGPAWQAEGLDDGQVYDALVALAKVPIEYRREPPPAPSPVEVTVAVSQQERTVTVEVGPADTEGFRSAKDQAGGSPFRIPASDFDEALAELKGQAKP